MMTWLFVCLAILVSGLSLVNSVPVLILKSVKSKEILKIPALSTIGSEEFKRYLSKKVIGNNFPKIIMFLENDLSIEDFSWQDKNLVSNFPNLEEAVHTVLFSEFFPSVTSPLEAVHSLVKFGYIIQYHKGTDVLPIFDEHNILWVFKLNNNKNRPDLLRAHDKLIRETYSKLLESYKNIIILYSGIKSPWEIESRHNFSITNFNKRAYQDDRPLLLWKSERVLLISKLNPVLNFRNVEIKFEDLHFEKAWGRRNSSLLHVRYSGAHIITLLFHFTTLRSYWKLQAIEFSIGSKVDILIPIFDISAPVGKSWHSSLKVIFISNSSFSDTTFTFNNLQLQLFFTTNNERFGPAVDTITFFTPVILECIVVVGLLLGILFFGILMLLDVKVHDKFDDEKTKPLMVVEEK